MTIFQLARMRRIELIALYLQTRPGYQMHHGSDVAEQAGGEMSRERLVTAIVATPQGRRLLTGVRR